MAIQQLYSENLEFPSNGDEDFIENSCGSNLFFLNTQQQQFMQLQNFSQKNQNFSLDNSFSLSLVNEIEKQKLEIDQFVTLQVCFLIHIFHFIGIFTHPIVLIFGGLFWNRMTD